MSQQAPGMSFRKGLTLLQVANKFRSEEKALKWIEKTFWPNGPVCPRCGSSNVTSNISHPTMTHRCREKCCAKKPLFTVRIGTVMERSHLSYRKWAIGMYLYVSYIKGISSMKLHRELGITQKSAWFMLHRLRESSKTRALLLRCPVEVDETYIGGKEKNKHKHKRLKAGRGSVGKKAIVGVKDRHTNQIQAKVVDKTHGAALKGVVKDFVDPSGTIFTDDVRAYRGLKNHHVVKHSIGEYVRQNIHTNGIESFWAMFKRGLYGTYHKMSFKHLEMYVSEFVRRNNIRQQDTLTQMQLIFQGMKGKRLTYNRLIT